MASLLKLATREGLDVCIGSGLYFEAVVHSIPRGFSVAHLLRIMVSRFQLNSMMLAQALMLTLDLPAAFSSEI